jgi:hypothetical protein
LKRLFAGFGLWAFDYDHFLVDFWGFYGLWHEAFFGVTDCDGFEGGLGCFSVGDGWGSGSESRFHALELGPVSLD